MPDVHRDMDPIATSMIVVYLVTASLVGSLLARRSQTSGEWAVADGGMGLLMIAVGVLERESEVPARTALPET